MEPDIRTALVERAAVRFLISSENIKICLANAGPSFKMPFVDFKDSIKTSIERCGKGPNRLRELPLRLNRDTESHYDLRRPDIKSFKYIFI